MTKRSPAPAARALSPEEIRRAMKRYGYRPCTPQEVTEEKALIARLRTREERN